MSCILKERWAKLGLVEQPCNPSTQEVEAGQLWGQPELHSETV
jgi:hypothetical protein